MFNIYTKQNSNNHLMNGNGGGEEKKIPKPDFMRYSDPTHEFESKTFKQSMWFVQNRVLLYKIGMYTLVGVAAGLWLFSLVAWGNYLIFGISADTRLYQQLATFSDYTNIHPRYTALPLQIVGANVFQGGVNKYDLVAEINNPNPNFTVKFSYHFEVDGAVLPTQQGFLLAGESRPIVQFGYEAQGYPSAPGFVLEEARFTRVDPHTVKDTQAYQTERLSFEVSGYDFISGTGLDAPDANALRFNLKNASPYGYKEANFVVAALDSGTMLGVLPLQVSNFKSMETRPIDLRSYVSNLNANEAQVFPMVDIYDATVYMEPER